MKSPSTPAEVVETLKTFFETHEWTSGFLALDADGCEVDPNDADADCWCALGALCNIAGVGRWEALSKATLDAVEDTERLVADYRGFLSVRDLAVINDKCKGVDDLIATLEAAVQS